MIQLASAVLFNVTLQQGLLNVIEKCFIYLFVYLFIYLFIYLFVYLLIYLLIY